MGAKPVTLTQAELDRCRRTAVRAALASGRVLRRYFTRPLRHLSKPDSSIVTVADRESEQVCRKILGSTGIPLDFLGEESGYRPHETLSVGRWIVDPLDGTTNFIHSFPMFCVSIGLEIRGVLVLGVIYQPITRELFIAEKGRGARRNGKKIHVSRVATLERALLSTGFSTSRDGLLRSELQAFEKLSVRSQGVRRPGAAALDLAYTACGLFDGFWENGLSPWDVAAGTLLVTEAGGRVTEFDGRTYRLGSRGIVASNRRIHGALLPILRRI